jgi:glycosyltransferase A (GT-A) superfamily protein (DUF2064 family)
MRFFRTPSARAKRKDAFTRVCRLSGLLFSILVLSVPASSEAERSNPSVAVRFKDVTQAAGIDFVHSRGPRSSLLPEDMCSGAGFADYDNDGDLDLYVVNIPGPLTEEVTSKSPGNVLYRNNGNATFTDVTEQAGVGDQGYGMGCVFGDYDNDGDLDLYVTNYGPNVLYRNNGDATFTDVTEQAGVGAAGWSTGSAFGDFDNDGDLDLYVPNYVEYDLDSLEQMQKKSKRAGQPIPSALNPHVFEPQDNVCYRNNGDGTFTDVTAELQVEARGGRSLQAIFTDFDLDGDLDLYIANDTSANFLYRNNGDGTFTNQSEASWAADFRGSMGLATGDYDNDGDLDILVTNCNQRPDLLQNAVGNRNNWIQIHVVGQKSNRSGIGAKIKVVAGTHVQYREVQSGGSYLSFHDLRTHFGVGKAEQIDLLEIRWTTGKIDSGVNLPTNQRYLAVEGSKIAPIDQSILK